MTLKATLTSLKKNKMNSLKTNVSSLKSDRPQLDKTDLLRQFE